MWYVTIRYGSGSALTAQHPLYNQLVELQHLQVEKASHRDRENVYQEYISQTGRRIHISQVLNSCNEFRLLNKKVHIFNWKENPSFHSIYSHHDFPFPNFSQIPPPPYLPNTMSFSPPHSKKQTKLIINWKKKNPRSTHMTQKQKPS